MSRTLKYGRVRPLVAMIILGIAIAFGIILLVQTMDNVNPIQGDSPAHTPSAAPVKEQTGNSDAK